MLIRRASVIFINSNTLFFWEIQHLKNKHVPPKVTSFSRLLQRRLMWKERERRRGKPPVWFLHFFSASLKDFTCWCLRKLPVSPTMMTKPAVKEALHAGDQGPLCLKRLDLSPHYIKCHFLFYFEARGSPVDLSVQISVFLVENVYFNNVFCCLCSQCGVIFFPSYCTSIFNKLYLCARVPHCGGRAKKYAIYCNKSYIYQKK